MASGVRRSEFFVSSLVLVHNACERIPAVRISIGWPSRRHGGHLILNLGVESTSEFDHYRLRVRIPSIRYKILEFIEVIVDRARLLEVSCGFEMIDGSRVDMRWTEFAFEFDTES